MKKKYFILLIFVLIIPFAFILTACGEDPEPEILSLNIIEKENNVNHDNFLDLGIYTYGSNPNLESYKLVLKYSDQTSKEISKNDSKLTVKYYFDDLNGGGEIEIENLNSLQTGFYRIKYVYNDKNKFEVEVTFAVEKTEYTNSYTLELSQNDIQYGDILPEITVIPSSGKVVESGVRYLNQSQYDYYLTLENVEKQQYLADINQKVYSNFYGDYVVGEYYIYAEISSDNYSNKFSEPTNLTVGPATIYKDEASDGTVTATLNYNNFNDSVIKTGNVKLENILIDDFSANIRYNDQYGQKVAGSLQWSQKDLEVNFDNNGDSFDVIFVPESENYNSIYFGKVTLNVIKGQIYFSEYSDNATYSSDIENKTFIIYNNNNNNFKPLDYIEVYKYNGSDWQKVSLDSETNYSLSDTVIMQAGEYKYKLCLKDKTNFEWRQEGMEGENSSEDIIVTKLINPQKIHANFEITGAELNNDGYVLLPFNNNDNRITNFSVKAINKENNGGLYGDYFKGSAEFIEIEGQTYIKYVPSGLYSSEGVENNSSDSKLARAYLKISATPINNNYYFEDYEYDVFIDRKRPGPNSEETVENPVEVISGKTYRECFTFMLPESLGSYSSSDIDLDAIVPDTFTQTQITLSFISNSPIYYSITALRFDVVLKNTQILDVE